MTRICQIVGLALLVVVWCGSAMALPHPKYEIVPKQIQKVDARSFDEPVTSQQRDFGVPYHVGASASPGTAAGLTYYDYQHNGSDGRQVDEFGGKVQGTWMKAPGPSPSIRTVRWNEIPVISSPKPYLLDNGETINRLDLGSPLLPLGQEFAAERPGYTAHRNRAGGKGCSVYHDAPESGGVQYWETQLDLTAGNGLFTVSGGVNEQPPQYQNQSDAVIWPQIATSVCGGDTLVHVIGFYSGANAEIWYWRGVVQGDGSVIYSAPYMIDPVDANITAVVEAFADTVVVAFAKQNNPTNADICYYRSNDCGVSWGPIQNVTNYTSTGPEGAYAEINAAFDAEGQLHIIWNTIPASGVSFPTNLYHWSQATGIRLITSAGWRNKCVGGTLNAPTGNGGGTNNLAIADMGLSVKPAGLGAGAGIAEELIYAIWTQFGPTINDCATVDAVGTLGGYVNGEVYVSASSNGGNTWDRPQNVTGTVTPDCLPGDCLSESWSTVAPFADSGIYLSYVRDLHAGPVVFGGGAWTESPYDFLAVEARPPVLEPVIAVTPTDLIELNAKTTGDQTTTFDIASVGNADLTFTVTVMSDNGGQSHVLVNGAGSYSSAITAGDPAEVITITYDGVGLPDPSEQNWRLEVTSNDKTNDPNQGGTPIDVNLQVFVSDVWFTCDQDTLSTGQHRLTFSSCLEMGDQGAVGNGFYTYSDSADWLFSGSPVLTLTDGSSVKHAYRNMFMTPNDRTRDVNQSFRSQSTMSVARGGSSDVATGTASTTDSTIFIDYEVATYKDPGLEHGATFKFTMTNVTGSPITNIDCGVACDIDVDPDAAENAGIASSDVGYIGGVGGAGDTSGFIPNTNYLAFFHLPLDAGCDRHGAVAGAVLANPTYVHPENALNTDSAFSLFDWVGAGGAFDSVIQPPDTPYVDIAVMMVSKYAFDLAPGTPVDWGYGLAVSDVSISDLETTIENLRIAANPQCEGCLVAATGDVNVNGSITSADIIYLVGYVFKGGPAPQPCAAGGDVNCNGSVTSADIIYLVGYVFKGGPAPCDVCTLVPDTWSCP